MKNHSTKQWTHQKKINEYFPECFTTNILNSDIQFSLIILVFLLCYTCSLTSSGFLVLAPFISHFSATPNPTQLIGIVKSLILKNKTLPATVIPSLPHPFPSYIDKRTVCTFFSTNHFSTNCNLIFISSIISIKNFTQVPSVPNIWFYQ